MKFTFIVFIISLTIPGKCKKPRVDFRGNLRKFLALEAALMNATSNMVCSPLAALVSIAKLTMGIDNYKSHELYDAIGMEIYQLKSGFRQVVMRLKTYDFLKFVDRIFIPDDDKIKKEFKLKSKELFNIPLWKMDFDHPDEAAAKINKWVSVQTGGMISKIVKPKFFDIVRTSMVVVNAVYFSAKWPRSFCFTSKGHFYSPNGAHQEIPMMSNLSIYQYYRSDILSAQLIRIPFEDKNTGLLIILPFSRRGIEELVKKLKSRLELLEHAIKHMKKQMVILKMPILSHMSSEFDLTKLYTKIGLKRIFTRDSEISNAIENESVYISEAVQITKIHLTENGVAPCTNISKFEFLNITIFNADHPFIFYGIHKSQQLFAGTFVHPQNSTD